MKQTISLHGLIRWKLHDLNGKLIESGEKDNLIVNVGKNVVAQRLNSENTYSANIDYGAVGTDASTVQATDTTLGTETFRKTPLSQSRSNNVTTITWNYAPTEANGSLKEFGAFIDGTASADSGQMFNHINIDVTKTTSNSLTIELVITVG